MGKTFYKLTSQEGTTRNDTRWEIGQTKTLPKVKSPRLCSRDVFHAYTGINLAMLLNPIHADFNNPRAWEVSGEVCIADWGKVGMFSQTLIREIDVPSWYRNVETRKEVVVLFAILCAESALGYFEKKYPGDDRPRKAVDAAKEYLRTKSAYAANAASHAAYDAADAAHDAADSARAASHAADAASYAAAAASYAAAYAARAASHAAAYAARAASRAAHDASHADAETFEGLADKAVEMIVSKRAA